MTDAFDLVVERIDDELIDTRALGPCDGIDLISQVVGKPDGRLLGHDIMVSRHHDVSEARSTLAAMAKVNKGRFTADTGADGKVLFLIGMRINSLLKVWRWMPVFVAMPRMISELMKNPELGMTTRPRIFLSGRTILVWQYWESFEKLESYSRSSDRAHLPAWRAFNKKIRDNGSVGIYHETILLSDASVETVYGNMPTFGLAGVTGAVPAGKRGQAARTRLRGEDVPPAVDPY